MGQPKGRNRERRCVTQFILANKKALPRKRGRAFFQVRSCPATARQGRQRPVMIRSTSCATVGTNPLA